MRDNAKGGALTEVTFFILLSLYTPKHGYAVMQFIEDAKIEEMEKESYRLVTMSFWGTERAVLVFKKGLKGSLL